MSHYRNDSRQKSTRWIRISHTLSVACVLLAVVDRCSVVQRTIGDDRYPRHGIRSRVEGNSKGELDWGSCTSDERWGLTIAVSLEGEVERVKRLGGDSRRMIWTSYLLYLSWSTLSLTSDPLLTPAPANGNNHQFECLNTSRKAFHTKNVTAEAWDSHLLESSRLIDMPDKNLSDGLVNLIPSA